MPTLGTQTISSSYAQLLKTFTTGGLSGALQVVTDGDDTSSALSLSTTGVSSTGSFSVTGDSILTGAVTLGSNLTASTGTATIGTLSASTATIGTLSATNTATVGTLKVGASGPRLTAVSYGTAAFTLSTVQPHNLADTTTGTFALTGAVLGDIVIGSIDSLGSTTGTTQIVTSFFPIASNVVRYVVNSKGSTAGTVPAGTIYATAMRFIA
jgi:hypothetical protein